jgi:mono/diheme cytochrome c family protein
MTNFFERRLQIKKTIVLLAFIVVVGIGSYLIYLIFAHDPMGGGMMGEGMMGEGMMGRGMRGHGMMGEGMSGSQQNGWQVPPNAANRKNPVPADQDSVATGKTLFSRYCASCHGMNGKGNGVAADLTDPAVQNQTDSALFWKISQGSSPMPSFKDILTERQRWDIVNYIRTLGS